MKRRTFVAALAAVAAPLPAIAQKPAAVIGVDMAALPGTYSVAMTAGGRTLGMLQLTLDTDDIREAIQAVERLVDNCPLIREPLMAYLLPGGELRDGLLRVASTPYASGTIAIEMSPEFRAALDAANANDIARLRALAAA